MDTTIKRWGNSQGIIIPKTILAKMGIDDPDGQPVTLKIDAKGRLIIEKKNRLSKLESDFKSLISNHTLKSMVTKAN
ncbi:AbrB/MazE/SpoVT family DNA-binding domain-containing protein [Lacticaseibacillus rhamnosus]|uniref:AbrB/MazE/SpoVT family DNA-binding domain-containing protein n=1 Tax=Lacticaseibacillus rhamnosus TaxID=47715 RepID=UPI000AF9F8C5|nr:AbrB/MazE/SpoVT family DNA-binding domain-containing protein [Lacticaseibacillus rhamnosus]MDK7182950.1 AbrB/MazE/SpoVT family DNA-binding domain-containing protein [Lacticaseibacillus rhamnosus]MDK7239863.1 AbrB/MazE/SpoVT family DNA-binding domain-containing protein [Lacticaseibacillus rhamnosus]MDT8863910.1 AbrB/MazE/SpoVT family DNA-binding domain-containing protein [Lacticaseibacillus rhamnosus]